MNQLRETLHSLDNYKLPEKFLTSDKTSSSTAVLQQRYTEARNEYLRRRILQTFFSQMETFDGQTFDIPPVPTPEQVQALTDRRDQVQSQVADAARQVHEQLRELEYKYSTLQTRKEELQRMVEEMETSNLDNGADDDDEAVPDVDEEELAAQEERLAALQLRKTELQARLQSVQQENMQIEKQTKETKIKLQEEYSITDISSESLQMVQEENEKLRAALTQAKDIQLFYDSLRAIMEELGGIKILGVEEAKEDDDQQDLFLKVQLLNEHDVLMGLKIDHKTKNQDNLRVVSAKFLTPTLVQAPGGDGETVVVEMSIPDLADLVRLSDNMPPGDDLRFVLQEAIGRITTIQARVKELALMHNEAVTKIGKSYHHANGFGGEDQEIVCSFNEQISAVLRLTPDCPMVKGSVYINQLVGFGGWDTQLVDQMKEHINRQLFSSPVELVRAIKAEIKRLEQEGVSVPKTPTMLARRHG